MMNYILVINVEMPTFFGILTFISRINTTSESYKAKKKNLYVSALSKYGQLKLIVQLSRGQYIQLFAC